jgi:hypothetical protein
MTKTADPNSKKGINIKSRSVDEENIISFFKSLANHLQVEVSDLFFEQAEKTLKLYNWPPNPQLQLLAFQGGTSIVENCTCGHPAVIWASHLPSKTDYKFCKECFSKIPMRYDSKIWRITRRKE